MKKKRYSIDCQCDFLTSIAFSQDDQIFATAGSFPAIRLWETASGKEHFRLPLSGEDASCDFFYWVDFVPDTERLLAIDSHARLWRSDTHSDQQRWLVQSLSDIVRAAIVPRTKVLALGTSGGSILLWDLIENRSLLVLDENARNARLITCVACSPKGTAVAGSTDSDNLIHVYSTSGQDVHQHLAGHSDVVLSLDYSPDGRLLASASRDNTVRIWDVEHGTEKAVIHGEGNIVRSVAFSPDGRFLAVGNGVRSFTTENEASAVSLFQATDATEVCRLVAHAASINCLRFSNNSRVLASGGDDGQVIVWDIGES